MQGAKNPLRCLRVRLRIRDKESSMRVKCRQKTAKRSARHIQVIRRKRRKIEQKSGGERKASQKSKG